MVMRRQAAFPATGIDTVRPFHSYAVAMKAETATAKLFTHGGSQAVRLPKRFRLPGREVRVVRTAKGVLLQALETDPEERRRRFVALAGSCPDLPDVPAHVTPDLPRDES
jgi:antitoxin VapB